MPVEWVYFNLTPGAYTIKDMEL